MDNHLVVGVGNIYANEALFRAGIRPTTPAGRLSRPRFARLVDAVREVLTEAIAKGGSTLRDYVDARGEPGYFQLDYFVYGRDGAAVPRLRGRSASVDRASAARSGARPASGRREPSAVRLPRRHFGRRRTPSATVATAASRRRGCGGVARRSRNRPCRRRDRRAYAAA